LQREQGAGNQKVGRPATFLRLPRQANVLSDFWLPPSILVALEKQRFYTMKRILITTVLASAFVVGSLNAIAADKKSDKKAAYPLKTCVVSDEKLGEMGKPFKFDYKGREVQLCCKDCKKDFDKDPAKYLKKLDDADKTKK
jgi:YHS domain-containing protein